MEGSFPPIGSGELPGGSSLPLIGSGESSGGSSLPPSGGSEAIYAAGSNPNPEPLGNQSSKASKLYELYSKLLKEFKPYGTVKYANLDNEQKELLMEVILNNPDNRNFSLFARKPLDKLRNAKLLVDLVHYELQKYK